MVILLLLLSVTCTSIGDVIGGDKPPSNCASIGKTLRVHAYGRNDVLQKELNRIAGDTEVKNPLCTVLSLVNGVGPYVLWNYTVIKRSIVIEASSGGVVIRCDPRKPRDDSRGSYEPFLAVSSSQHLIPYVSIRGGITFTDCKLPVIINNTKIVKIRDVAFENFTGGALHIINSCRATITDSLFVNNTSKELGHSWHIFTNGGGLLVFNNFTDTFVNNQSQYCKSRRIVTIINNCTFVNNSALVWDTKMEDSNPEPLFCSDDNHPYSRGRGGGVALIFNQTGTYLQISNCKFDNNSAHVLGGAMYLLNYNHFGTYVIQNNAFYNNCVDNTDRSEIGERYVGGGGAAFIGMVNFHTMVTKEDMCVSCFEESSLVAVSLVNNVVINNRGKFGAGVLIEPSDYTNSRNILVKNCTFRNNKALDYGGALAIASLTHFPRLSRPKTIIRDVTMEDNIFSNNSAVNGIVSSQLVTVKILGVNTFKHNKGTCLRLVAASCHIIGKLEFLENQVTTRRERPGASVSLVSFGQLFFHQGARVLFQRNHGFVGASIAVDTFHSIPFLKKNPFYSLCFINAHEEMNKFDLSQLNITVVFSENKAVLGPAVLAEGITVCDGPRRQLLCQSAFQYRNNSSATCPLNSTYMSMLYTVNPGGNGSDTHDSRSVNSTIMYPTTPAYHLDHVGDDCPSNATFCDIVSGVRTLHTNITSIVVYPGEEFTVWINPIDASGTPASAIIQTKAVNYDHDSLYVLPQYMNLLPNSSVMMRVGLKKNISKIFKTQNYTLSFTRRVLHDIKVIDETRINLTVRTCPLGYHLTYNKQHNAVFCECNIDGELILDCQDGKVILKAGLWAYINGNNELRAHFCPAGYCNDIYVTKVRVKGRKNRSYGTFDCKNPDEQCVPKRQGILCGKCRKGNGVSALLGMCSECQETKQALIFAMVASVLGVVIVTLLVPLVLPVHFPAWMHPYVFYVQVSSYSVVSFAEYPLPYFRYMVFLGSFLGLYYPYDFCLMPDAKSVDQYGMRFTPSIILMVLAPAILIPARLLCRRRFTWSGLWILFQLVLNSLLYNIFSAFHCIKLEGIDGTVWFNDGTLTCFTEWHSVLVVVAVIMLLTIFAFVSLITVAIFKPKRLPSILRLLKEEVSLPYRAEYSRWALVDLLRRFIAIILIVIFPSKPILTVCWVMVCFAVYSYIKPYRQRLVVYIEWLLLFNFLIILIVAKIDSDGNYDPRRWLSGLFYLPVPCVPLAAFLAFVWRPVRDAFMKYTTHGEVTVDRSSLRRGGVTQSSLRAKPLTLMIKPLTGPSTPHTEGPDCPLLLGDMQSNVNLDDNDDSNTYVSTNNDADTN